MSSKSFETAVKSILRNIMRLIVFTFHSYSGRRHTLSLQKICFFYLPEVPDFGNDFLYVKLGKKELLKNSDRKQILFEADLPDNIAHLNSTFLDYSGLYALYKNNVITQNYLLVIHYDAKIMFPDWIPVVHWNLRKSRIVFSEWPIDMEKAEISKWVYERIDEILLHTHGSTFLSYIRDNQITKLPNSSQFACSHNDFKSLMEFLMPVYEFIINQKEFTYKYAHLMERVWGLYWALTGYKKVPVLIDSHANSKTYGENASIQVINFPLLTRARNENVTRFSDILRF